MIRNICIMVCLVELYTSDVSAQFSSTSTFFIQANTQLSINGLHFQTSANTTALSNRILTMSSEPIKGSPTASIKRVYHFNEQVVLSGMVGVSFDPSELNGNMESDLQVAYFNTEEKYVTTKNGDRNLDEHRVSKQFNNQKFLRITAVNSNSALPVTLASFHAIRMENQAHLVWNTTNETNSAYFNIMRSADGQDWQIIGQMQAKGDSKDLVKYDFYDTQPLPGHNLYRLKMFDMDFSFAYSRTIALDFSSLIKFNIYPNPVHEQLSIDLSDWSEVKEVQLISQWGQSVLLTPSGEKGSVRTYDCSNVETGLYLIKVIRNNGQQNTQRIVKI